MQPIVLGDAVLEPRFVLRERPRLPIRLVGSSAATILSTRAAPLVAACAPIDGSGTIEAVARRDLAERLSRARYEPRVAVLDATRGLAAVERPLEGTYELSLRLGSVVVAHAPVVVSPARPEGEVLDVPTMGGRLVRARVTLPAVLHRWILADQLAVRFVSSADPQATFALAADPFLVGSDDGVALWMPDEFDTLEVSSRDEGLLPVLPARAHVGEDGSVRLDVALRDDVATVTVRVALGPERAAPDGWDVLVTHAGASDGGEGGITSLRTGAGGSATVLLREGTYDIRATPSFVRPFAHTEVSVRRGVAVEVVVSLVDGR